ncbi:MAG: UDP-N-acetylglucosamine diphosphorylase [Armatimonadetes bacterium]|nr:UDP-N-acetylglucosamine diphosphorylase [Armatimonadota bacterium]MDW8120880.1 UDP-N-acetylglucosamine diphosphorylase [Armatimonadota bacterium]
MTDERLTVHHYFHIETFRHRDIFEQLEKVWDVLPRIGEYVESVLKEEILGRVMKGAFIEGRVEIKEGTVVEPGACLLGPVIIGKNCQVRHGAYLRGPVLVGDEVVLGHGSEFKNCILLDGAQVPHLSYVGDSVIGNRSHLGASVIVANLKLTRNEIVVKLDGAEFPTGLKKFGVILGDGAEIGCQSVINPGTLIGPGTIAYPLSSLRGYYPPGSLIKTRTVSEVSAKF